MYQITFVTTEKQCLSVKHQHIALEIPKPINLLSFFYLITAVILQN